MSRISCKFTERVKLAVNLEKEPIWLWIWRKRQNSYQFGDEANFPLTSGIFQVAGRLLGKCLNFRKIGFISKFTAILALSKLIDNLTLSPNLQIIQIFFWIFSWFGFFSECTIRCLVCSAESEAWNVECAVGSMQCSRAPERWEWWECVPSQFEILAATFG